MGLHFNTAKQFCQQKPRNYAVFLFSAKKIPFAESYERDFLKGLGFYYLFRKLFSFSENKSSRCSRRNNRHCGNNSDNIFRTGVGVLFGGRTAVVAVRAGTVVTANSYFLCRKNVAAKGGTCFAFNFDFYLIVKVYFAEIDFDQLIKMTKKSKVQFKELSKFPEVKRDLALLVNKSVTFSQLRSIAFATEKKLLKSVSLFDVYEGDKLPEGKKSYALSFILEDKNQTLTDKQIERTMANLQAQLEQKTGAEIRK